MKLIKEHFDSIHQMISVIESRPNNAVMKNSNSSHRKGESEWFGTSSYQEAKDLFESGYTEILEKIKTGVSVNLKKTQTENRRRVSLNVVGYAPHIPNAIMGLPNSMILTEAKPQKVKAVSVTVGITENCGTNAEEFIQSGIAALGIVNTLELRGYRVNLNVAFYCATAGNEAAFATVTVKGFREHLDLQKLCFPLAHPSMFRRLGFKWLETTPEMENAGWQYGYGSQTQNLEFIKENFLLNNEFFINLAITKKHKYDIDKLIELMNLK